MAKFKMIRQEAQLLSMRTGLKARACEKWMLHVGITSIPDLMHKWPDLGHGQAMARARDEIEALVLA